VLLIKTFHIQKLQQECFDNINGSTLTFMTLTEQSDLLAKYWTLLQ